MSRPPLYNIFGNPKIMKYVFLLISVIVFFTGCENFTYRQKSTEGAEKTRYENTLQRELSSGEKTDTIFLGFRFGMTKAEVSRHTRALTKQGKLTSKGKYLFTFDEYTTAEAKIGVHYFEGKLYQFQLYVTPTGIVPITVGVKVELYKLYNEKYDCTVLFSETPLGTKNIFLRGNLKIELYERTKDVMVEYSDMNIVKVKEDMEKEQVEKDMEKAKDDI